MAGSIEGTVVSIGESGNLVTDIDADKLSSAPREADRVTITCDDHVTNGIFDGDHQEPPFTLLALIGASGALELEIVGDSAQMMLGIAAGAKVQVKWQ